MGPDEGGSSGARWLRWGPGRSLAIVLTDQSHLAPLDPPHPSLLRNATFSRKRGEVALARISIFARSIQPRSTRRAVTNRCQRGGDKYAYFLSRRGSVAEAGHDGVAPWIDSADWGRSARRGRAVASRDGAASEPILNGRRRFLFLKN